MTARTTMSSLITALRGMCNAGTADYTIAGSAFWSDDQLQKALDKTAQNIYDEVLASKSVTYQGGSVAYYDYFSRYINLENTDGGTARFIIKNDTWGTVSDDDYTVDYDNGKIVFADSTEGKTRYLTGFSYDLYAAAADIWEQIAGHYTVMVDFSTDNHSVKRSHMVAAAQSMARRYKAMSGGSESSFMERRDTSCR